MPAEITVENVRRDHPSPAVEAEFDCRLGSAILIRGLRLVRGKGGGLFVGLPSRRRQGTDEWVEVVSLSEALKARVQAAAEAEIGTDASAPF